MALPEHLFVVTTIPHQRAKRKLGKTLVLKEKETKR
jgi:hypothetical protein